MIMKSSIHAGAFLAHCAEIRSHLCNHFTLADERTHISVTLRPLVALQARLNSHHYCSPERPVTDSLEPFGEAHSLKDNNTKGTL